MDVAKEMGQVGGREVGAARRRSRNSAAAMADDELLCGQPSGLEETFVEAKQREIRGLYVGGNGEANSGVNRANLIRESNSRFRKRAAIPAKI